MKQLAQNYKSGQSQNVARFVDACQRGTPRPISLESLLATTRASIAVGESLTGGRPERM